MRNNQNIDNGVKNPGPDNLVLGLGNPILSDDAVGLMVVSEIERHNTNPNVTVLCSSSGGLNLIDLIVGYKKVVIVDAIQTCKGSPGHIYRLGEENLPASCNLDITHGLNFGSMLQLARKTGLNIPSDIVIFAIEAKDVTSFNEALSPEVLQAVNNCIALIQKELAKPIDPV